MTETYFLEVLSRSEGNSEVGAAGARPRLEFDGERQPKQLVHPLDAGRRGEGLDGAAEPLATIASRNRRSPLEEQSSLVDTARRTRALVDEREGPFFPLRHETGERMHQHPGRLDLNRNDAHDSTKAKPRSRIRNSLAACIDDLPKPRESLLVDEIGSRFSSSCGRGSDDLWRRSPRE